jgi:hypothetical protein
MELSPSGGAANSAATQELPAFYGTRRFITVFTRALHWSLSWARSIQFIPSHPISLRYILILITTYVLFFLVVSFLLAFPPISNMQSSSPSSCYIPFPSHPPWLLDSNYTWRRVQVMKLLIMQFSPTSCHFISLRSKYSPQTPSGLIIILTMMNSKQMFGSCLLHVDHYY